MATQNHHRRERAPPAMRATMGRASAGNTIQRASHSTISKALETAAGFTGLRNVRVSHEAILKAGVARNPEPCASTQ